MGGLESLQSERWGGGSLQREMWGVESLQSERWGGGACRERRERGGGVENL